MAEPRRSDSAQPKDSESASKLTGDLSNAMLGEFKLLKKLGTGGMAEVYLAEQTTLRRQVAVKIMRPEFITEEQYVKRFRHEAAAAGSLNHPNIVQVYMVGEQDGINYIAQEYVQGRTLKDYVNRKGPMEIKIALHILRQVASALQVASENGIVHRDVKPENILLTSKGEAKVADFGLAQLTLQGERVSLTQTGITMGTPLYMSPEQINGQPLDARSDMYSFGIMAWHILAGRPPFTGETAMAVAVKHLNEKPPLLTDFRPEVSPQLRDLIKRLIQKKKDDRYTDFGAVLTEIKQIIRQVTGKEDATIPLKPPSSTFLPVVDHSLRKQAIWLSISCVVIMAASAGVGWTMRTPELNTVVSTGAPRVNRMPTADGQLFWALTHPNDEAAWILVKDYDGASDEFKARAQTALGLIYLKTNRRKLAEATFDELAIDSKFKVNGYAGQALAAGLRGELDNARKLVAQVDASERKIFPELDDAFKELHQRFLPPK